MNASAEYLNPEARARIEIDQQLVACGWVVQDYQHAAVAAARGVAVREVPTEAGPADYVLYVDSRVVGVIEAKKEDITLTGVEPQTRKYQAAYPEQLPAFLVDGALPFGYEATGTVTRFTCGLDPTQTSRPVFAFHRPETLTRWWDNYNEFDGNATLRSGFGELPDLGTDPPGLWPAQAEAIRNLEASFMANRTKALIQMATGSGKTFTAVNASYRLLRHEPERFKRYIYDELIARDKVSLDLFWLRDESLEDIDNLPAPAVLAAEIAEDLQSALTESLAANGGSA